MTIYIFSSMTRNNNYLLISMHDKGIIIIIFIIFIHILPLICVSSNSLLPPSLPNSLDLSPLLPLPPSPLFSLLSPSYGLQGHGVTSPNTSLMVELITDAFVIAIISFVINISQAKLIAKKNGYSVHPDQVCIQ